MVHLKVTKNVELEDLSHLVKYVDWNKGHMVHFMDKAGREHYKLLSYLSKQLPEGTQVADIGTCAGHSAMALVANPKIRVVTYDIEDHFRKFTHLFADKLTMKDHPQIEFRLANCLFPVEMHFLRKTPLIFLDVDPHDGIQEEHIIQSLKDYGFKGIVLCDDIHLNPAMENWWQNKIPAGIKKLDLTAYGHFTGTGALIFDESAHTIEICEN